MQLIEQIEAQALSFRDLQRMLGPAKGKTRLIEYDELMKVRSIEDLFSGKVDAVIILLTIEGPNAPSVGHWIAILNHKDHVEHFDPYGLTVDEELGLTHEKPYLSDLLNKSNKRVVDSAERLQARREDVNTCGRWCIARVRLKDETLREFSAIIKTAHAAPDVTISLMTMWL
jgi:hypothetical protein